MLHLKNLNRLFTSTTYSCSMCSVTTNKKIASLVLNKIKQRVTLFINPAILKHAKAQAIVDEITLTSLVEKALVNYLPKKTVIKKLQTNEN